MLRTRGARMNDGAYDVIVTGGGAAGVGAALGAAHAGARVALVERAPSLGGAATQSNVLTYCGLWTQSDPPVPVVGGVGAAVLAEIAALGGDAGPKRMGVSNVVVALLDPEIVKLALDRVCERADVDVILHATVVTAESTAAAVRSVRVADHAGTAVLRARAFVDASGEADLAARAGASVRYGGSDGAVQNGTLVVRFGGIAPDADTSRLAWERAIRAAKERGETGLSKEQGLVVRLPISNDVVAYLIDEAYDARDARSIGAAERRGRRQAWRLLDAIRALPGHERAYIVQTGPAIGTRESRHVVARYQLQEAEVVAGARFVDAVALGSWPVEHHPGPGQPNRWVRIAGDGAYEIPLRALQSASAPNLFAAGRTIDADEGAFASLRVMGTAFATGHAAGVAAAHVAAGNGANPEAIRTELRRQGALVAVPATERSPSS